MKTTMMAMAIMLVALFGATSAMASKYVVRGGDTLSTISKKTGVSVSEIAKANSIKNINRIGRGQVLSIPEKAVAKVLPVKAEKQAQKTYPAVAVPQNYRVTHSVPVVSPAIAAKKTQENLALAREKRMTASLEPMPIREVGKEGESEEKSPNKFLEASATLGGWRSGSAGTSGIYGVAEATGWIGNKDGDQNYGLGIFGEVDKGKGRNGVKWGSEILAIQPSFWKNIDDKNFLLLKPRIGIRFNDKPTSKPASGLVLGGYGEVSRVLSPRDLGIIAGDGWYFQDDSYAAVRVWWERMVSQDWKIKAGVGPVGHWSKDESSFGISPALAAKYNDTVTFGVTADTSKGGPFVGGFITLDYNSDIHHPFGKKASK